jgi:hypothetical protein
MASSLGYHGDRKNVIGKETSCVKRRSCLGWLKQQRTPRFPQLFWTKRPILNCKPLSMRKTNLARLLARRPDGVFVAPFEQGD